MNLCSLNVEKKMHKKQKIANPMSPKKRNSIVDFIIKKRKKEYKNFNKLTFGISLVLYVTLRDANIQSAI